MGAPVAVPMSVVRISTFYRFVALGDLDAVQRRVREACRAHGVRGTVLLAAEGINGTLAGAPEAMDAVLAVIRAVPGLGDLETRDADAAAIPFERLRVRLKREIVTLGVPGVDAATGAGTYVDPADWNALLDDPDVVVVDARNDYEVAIGTFEGAVDPETARFRDLPAWLDACTDVQAAPRVAMFCTGGIRCEKSTAYLRARGAREVLHLRGGILAYLDAVPEAESRWTGECFVFDERVSVGHGLAPGTHTMCRGCGRPDAACHCETTNARAERA